MAKYILPWFGGTSGVWSASLLFFQVLLTAGYGYANILTSRLPRRLQGRLHLFLLGLSILLLTFHGIRWDSAILPDVSWRPRGVDQPLVNIVTTLFVAIGIPYLLLSSNSTLMQAWFSYENDKRSPYTLYAVSNAGSFVGLISYPFVLEPLLRLKIQSFYWTSIYVLFVLLTGYQALRVQYKRPVRREDGEDRDHATLSTTSLNQQVSWVFLAGLATVLLLATTNQITQEVAAVPFLWVIPLSIYLISFILTFSNERFYNRSLFSALLIVTTILFIWFTEAATTKIPLQIAMHASLLFVGTMICHGELYQLRPKHSSLTHYYLMVSMGGALGGVAVNLVFPAIFSGFWEYQLGVGLLWIYLLLMQRDQPISNRYLLNRGYTVILGAAAIVVFASLYLKVNEYENNSLLTRRNFFGILRIKELSENDPEYHRKVLTHGITTHGFQFTSSEKKMLPTSYYSEKSGIGIVFAQHPSRTESLEVGFIGLGAGVTASYGQEGDQFWFYEINPAVAEIAQGDHFTFLEDTPADVHILLGDGRILLERELREKRSRQFDLIVVDAFNSDSIPTHLLTLEAVELYLAHLETDGLLALHISNRFLNLAPVVWQIADTIGIDGITFFDRTKDDRISPSRWIVLTNNQSFLSNAVVRTQRTVNDDDYENLRLWTDDYSNLLTVLK